MAFVLSRTRIQALSRKERGCCSSELERFSTLNPPQSSCLCADMPPSLEPIYTQAQEILIPFKMFPPLGSHAVPHIWSPRGSALFHYRAPPLPGVQGSSDSKRVLRWRWTPANPLQLSPPHPSLRNPDAQLQQPIKASPSST